MPDLRDWIACGCCELSTPFLYRFRQESTLSNPKKLASRFGVTLSVALPKSRRCPRTSSHDQFVPATRGSHCGFFAPLGRGHRYRFPLRTSESLGPGHYGRGCNKSGTSDIGHPFDELAVQFRKEPREREQPCAPRVIFRGRRDGRLVPEKVGQSHLRLSGPCSRASFGWRKWGRQMDPGRQSPAVSRR